MNYEEELKELFEKELILLDFMYKGSFSFEKDCPFSFKMVEEKIEEIKTNLEYIKKELGE